MQTNALNNCWNNSTEMQNLFPNGLPKLQTGQEMNLIVKLNTGDLVQIFLSSSQTSLSWAPTEEYIKRANMDKFWEQAKSQSNEDLMGVINYHYYYPSGNNIKYIHQGRRYIINFHTGEHYEAKKMSPKEKLIASVKTYLLTEYPRGKVESSNKGLTLGKLVNDLKNNPNQDILPSIIPFQGKKGVDKQIIIGKNGGIFVTSGKKFSGNFKSSNDKDPLVGIQRAKKLRENTWEKGKEKIVKISKPEIGEDWISLAKKYSPQLQNLTDKQICNQLGVVPTKSSTVGEYFVENMSKMRTVTTADFTKNPKLALQLIDKVQKLNSFGLVHRDLKPDNILLDPNGNVCMADLECVSGMATESLTGTIDYCSPEVVHAYNIYNKYGPCLMLNKASEAINYLKNEVWCLLVSIGLFDQNTDTNIIAEKINIYNAIGNTSNLFEIYNIASNEGNLAGNVAKQNFFLVMSAYLKLSPKPIFTDFTKRLYGYVIFSSTGQIDVDRSIANCGFKIHQQINPQQFVANPPFVQGNNFVGNFNQLAPQNLQFGGNQAPYVNPQQLNYPQPQQIPKPIFGVPVPANQNLNKPNVIPQLYGNSGKGIFQQHQQIPKQPIPNPIFGVVAPGNSYLNKPNVIPQPYGNSGKGIFQQHQQIPKPPFVGGGVPALQPNYPQPNYPQGNYGYHAQGLQNKPQVNNWMKFN